MSKRADPLKRTLTFKEFALNSAKVGVSHKRRRKLIRNLNYRKKD